MDVQGRMREMGAVLKGNPSLLLKLAAASMSYSLVTAKLYSYQMGVLTELKKDKDFYDELSNAYSESAESELFFSEMFVDVSLEVDKLILEMNGENESR